MAMKQRSVEEIISKLREAEVVVPFSGDAKAPATVLARLQRLFSRILFYRDAINLHVLDWPISRIGR